MNIFSALLTITGLGLFESVNSIDNAIINAEILSTVSAKARRWFMIWGFLFAVVVVRGLLPLLIIWAVNPSLGPIGSLFVTFKNDPKTVASIERSAPILLMCGGTFLLFLFFQWLFLEPKHFGLAGERFIYSQGIWFFAVSSILLTIIVWFALKIDPLMAFGSVIGSTIFFITHGFKQNAELTEKNLMKSGIRSEISKLIFLEIIDATFSIDGVLGAFAFTLSVPLIFLGNGLGSFILRQLTITNMVRIKRYRYLKNGAMYSILFLGLIMILESFGLTIPSWVSPSITLFIVGYFLLKSKREFI